MSKGQIKLLGGTLSLLLSLIVVSAVAAQSFAPVFEWTKRVQKGEEIELKVHVGTDSFTFLRSRTTEIDQTTFQRLCGDTPPQQIKVLPDEELVFEYQINKLLQLEQTLRGNKPSAWRKIEFLEIASYPLIRWTDFLEQAVSQGLMEYELIEYEGESFVSLTFKQTDPSSLRFGTRSIRFSDEFYEDMKIVKEFKPWVGNTNNFVILVHEPHWSLSGQYQLIPGLKAFIDTNSQYQFRFLVEGYWEEEIKYIRAEPILDRFSKDVSKEAQVFALLRNFLIDGPFAYRLLYDPDLPALAIDDPERSKKTPPEQKIKDWTETSEVAKSIIQKLQGLPSDEIQNQWQILSLWVYYVRADASELKGPDIIKHLENVVELYDALIKSLETLQDQDFASEISFLEKQVSAYRTNSKRYQFALDGDYTMATNILTHFTSEEYSNRIPMAFIGNFHTPAITSHLRSEGIGYVVIEPRVSLIATEREKENFNGALNKSFDTQYNYLRDLIGDLKLQVAPLPRELPYYKSFLEREAPKIRRQKIIFRASSPLSPDNTSKIYNILERNGILSNAQAIFAGSGQTPPPKLPGAFASFSFGPGGENPKLIIYDREEENWEHSDRLSYLEKILPILPYEKFQRETRKASFSQDKETKRMFLWLFDPQTQKFYLFEGEETINIFKLLPLPKPKDEEEALIHIRISIRDWLHKEKEKVLG